MPKILRSKPRSSLGAFHTTTFIFAYLLFKHAIPQAINRKATRNISTPTGNTAAIKIPNPSARAQIPRHFSLFPFMCGSLLPAHESNTSYEERRSTVTMRSRSQEGHGCWERGVFLFPAAWCFLCHMNSTKTRTSTPADTTQIHQPFCAAVTMVIVPLPSISKLR